MSTTVKVKHLNEEVELEFLKKNIKYDPVTGHFTWIKKRKGRNHAIGSKAGYTDAYGYLTIGINYKIYKAHRLAWLYMTGKWPKNFIDHINRDPSDNRWENLREATRSQNQINSKVPSSSKLGIKGIRLRSYGKY